MASNGSKESPSSPNEAPGKNPIIFQTNFRFFLAFLFLIILTFGTFFILLNQVKHAEKDALVIGVIEDQYGFVHRATFLASSYAQSNDYQERQNLRESVREVLSSIIAFTSQNLEQPSFKKVLPEAIEERIHALYLSSPAKLNQEMLGYISSVKNFLMRSPVHMSSENPQLRALQAKTLQVLKALRATVKRNQEESRAKIQFLNSLGIFFFSLTVLCLFFLWLFVFVPTIRRIASYLSQISNINEELERKVKERTFELEKKASELMLSNQRLQEQIQERSRAENALREANVFLDSVIENIPDMIFIKDAEELRFVRFNKAGEGLLGLNRRELIGKNDYSFFPKEQAEFFEKKDRETLRNNKLVEILDEPITTRHKGARILHTKKLPILDASGKPAYLLGISEDITERIQSENQLRELSMAMENALDGIAKLDSNLKYLNVNKAYAIMLGYSPEELTGLNLNMTVCAEDHGKVKTAFGEMKKSKKIEAEVKALRKDGTIFHQYLVIVRAVDKDQNFEGFYCFARDITEHKYREAIEIKSELIQIVSHELRTPIHSVKEGISIVLEGLTGNVSAEQREVLEIAKRCAERLSRLVSDVLAFHKLDAGVIEFNIEKNDVNKLIEQVVQTMSPLAKEKKLDMEMHLQKDLPEVKMDHDKIVQVLTNLLQNAVKFTDKGSITVTSGLTEHGVKVTVKDTGIGIQHKDFAKIFRKFGQLEAAKSIAPGGAGLGLAISKKIVEQHHGKIEVDSSYKHGSSFSFILPVS